MADRRWDCIVIGAGLGGLMSAALVRRRFPDRSVLVLESHTDVGGCAGCFERTIALPGYEQKQRVRLDVGATTLSALGAGQSLRRVLDELSVTLRALQAEPGLRVVLSDGTVINRYADRTAWYAESLRHFGENSLRLWEALEEIERSSWKLLEAFPRFPPASVKDVLSLIKPSAVLGVKALQDTARPLWSLLRELDLTRGEKLLRFIDELLLVSTQTTSRDVSVLAGALGLIYPSQTYYVDGGVYALSAALLKKYLEIGGEVRFKKKVEKIARDKKGFTVRTLKSETFTADRVISNATIWNTRQMLENDLASHRYFHKWDDVIRGNDVWGANCYYAIVPESVGDDALFHQFHTADGSTFISLSRRGDHSRVPSGYRTLTASTHEADPGRWFAMSREAYDAEKEQLKLSFEKLLCDRLEGFADSTPPFAVVGTPLSFEFYTLRREGLVGGIAYKAGRMPWHWPSPVTPIRGLHIVGDTIFPGQSAGAIAQCAISLVSRF